MEIERRKLSFLIKFHKWNFHWIKQSYKNKKHPWMGNWEFYIYD